MGTQRRVGACPVYGMYGQSRTDQPYTQAIGYLEARVDPGINALGSIEFTRLLKYQGEMGTQREILSAYIWTPVRTTDLYSSAANYLRLWTLQITFVKNDSDKDLGARYESICPYTYIALLRIFQCLPIQLPSLKTLLVCRFKSKKSELSLFWLLGISKLFVLLQTLCPFTMIGCYFFILFHFSQFSKIS